MRIFEQSIKQYDQLTHDCGEGDLGGLTAFTEAFIEDREDGVASAGSERGHIQYPAHGGAAAGDVPLAPVLAAVVVKRSDSSQGGGLVIGDGAELRHESQDGQGTDSTHPGYSLKPLCSGGERSMGSHMGVDQRVELGELSFQLALPSRGEFEQGGQVEVLPPADLFGDQRYQVLPAFDQLGKVVFTIGRHRIRPGVKLGAIVGKHARVDRVGLGQSAARTGKVTHLARVDHAHGSPGLVQRADQRPLVATGRLTDVVGKKYVIAAPGAYWSIDAGDLAIKATDPISVKVLEIRPPSWARVQLVDAGNAPFWINLQSAVTISEMPEKK